MNELLERLGAKVCRTCDSTSPVLPFAHPTILLCAKCATSWSHSKSFDFYEWIQEERKRIMKLTEQEIQDAVPCRTCRAKIGESCKAVTGDDDLWTGNVHETRYIDAEFRD